MAIYAALGVGEVLRHDGSRMRIHVLQGDGRHDVSRKSRCFAWLDVPAFVSFLRKPEDVDETT